VSAVLTLVVPGCCGPLPEKSAALKYLQPALHQLPLWKSLSRAHRTPAAANYHQQLAALFICSDDNHAFPYAALDLFGEGGSTKDAFWLHADPVCMQADMDHAILFDAQSLQLAEHEADQLIAELNAHFSQDDISLQRGSAANWYLALNSHSDISTSTLHEVVGRNVNQFMPTGSDAQHWKRFMNESQMLLHASEVNQQREARGHLPVNSLWLWGEGRLPAPAESKTTFDRVLANNACARGLAKLNGVICETVPSDLTAFLNARDQSGHICVVLDDLFSSTSYADVAVWQEKLIALSETWLQPLLHYAAGNRITVQFYPCNGSAYCLRASDRYRLWRRGGIKDHLRLDV
jgi:hypothetical protein